jgi:hypothetical protein
MSQTDERFMNWEFNEPGNRWSRAALRSPIAKGSQICFAPVMAPTLAKPWKTPPLVKIYEAIGAIGDGRVHLDDEWHATVLSSDHGKTYQVEISKDGRQISSNDNASYWQDYLGYPAIAVMLVRGSYPVGQETLDALSGIPWKELNRRFRNDYERTIDEAMRRAEERGFDPKLIKTEAVAVLSWLIEYAPLRGARRRPPRSFRQQ